MPLHRRHLIDIADFSRDEFDSVLETAVSMRQVLERPISRVPTLRGKSIVNVFFEASTRTRVSFELAGKSLSADVVNVASSGSSIEIGWPSITASASMPPTPQPRAAKPLTIVVWLSVPTSVSG